MIYVPPVWLLYLTAVCQVAFLVWMVYVLRRKS